MTVPTAKAVTGEVKSVSCPAEQWVMSLEGDLQRIRHSDTRQHYIDLLSGWLTDDFSSPTNLGIGIWGPHPEFALLTAYGQAMFDLSHQPMIATDILELPYLTLAAEFVIRMSSESINTVQVTANAPYDDNHLGVGYYSGQIFVPWPAAAPYDAEQTLVTPDGQGGEWTQHQRYMHSEP